MHTNSFLPFNEISLSSIRPKGWLNEYLKRQRDGLTGHLEVAGHPFNTDGWKAPHMRRRKNELSRWWPYEQYAYWVDGMMRCGLLLKDSTLMAKAQSQIDRVLSHANKDGYLGPKFLKQITPEIPLARWSHAVFFRALLATVTTKNKTQIIQKLVAHFLSDSACHDGYRNVCNLEIIAWLFQETGDERFRQMAIDDYASFNQQMDKHDVSVNSMLSNRRASEHGVSYNEMAKLGAILYRLNGKKRWLRASVNAYKKLDRDHMLISGVPSSNEHLGGKDSLATHETCDIADFTWSSGHLLMTTGDAAYADNIERACFNAAPGAVTKDFKALQYFSGANIVVADRYSNHNKMHFGGANLSYRPQPATACCPGNVHRIMPNYVARMWMHDTQGGVVAALYGPSQLKTTINKQSVSITQTTRYPFEEQIVFTFRTRKPVKFPFTLRIPAWCDKPTLYVNKRKSNLPLPPGQFVTLNRTFKDHDEIRVNIPMSIRMSSWPDSGIGIERGPLVYAYPIPEQWERDKTDPNSSPEFPAWNVTPAGPWNYALSGTHKSLVKNIEFESREVNGYPWNPNSSPVALHVPARRVPGWKIKTKRVLHKSDRKLTGHFQFTPALPSNQKLRQLSTPTEVIRLIPYGCTHLRIAVFPHA